ncbi:MAG TPA: catalase family protein [Candidatus Solibacter sp.]|nr:catalase family protein [Candidatus Solibacter sp.]
MGLRSNLDSLFERLADTKLGAQILQFISDSAFGFAKVIRRPVGLRKVFDRTLNRPIASTVQFLKNVFRKNQHLKIAEERMLPNEDQITADIIEVFRENLLRRYITRKAERGANAKTYGVARAEFRVLAGLPDDLAKGVFREAKTYRAWVRFADTGSVITPDPEHVGVVGIGIKLMGVPGPKLMDDEVNTQDFTLIGVRSFTAADTVGMTKLQTQILKYRPAAYFFNPLYPGRFLDFIMQSLDSRLLGSPLESQLYSCTPFLHGEGQAVHYSVKPLSSRESPIPVFASDNYLREALIQTLRQEDVEYDFMVQLQKDSFRQPIEDASIEWKESETPFIPVARLFIPKQRIDSAAQLAFADVLSINPWHCIAEHRPLGSINRNRKAMYSEMAKLRQQMNGVQHCEPTGDEQF